MTKIRPKTTEARAARTIMNWRWWATAPLFLLLLFLLPPIAAVTWVVEGMSNGAAKLTQALITWRDGK
ncbi:MAG TPA: hypothetical protein VIK75_06550 [Calditerricola sp.]